MEPTEKALRRHTKNLHACERFSRSHGFWSHRYQKKILYFDGTIGYWRGAHVAIFRAYGRAPPVQTRFWSIQNNCTSNANACMAAHHVSHVRVLLMLHNAVRASRCTQGYFTIIKIRRSSTPTCTTKVCSMSNADKNHRDQRQKMSRCTRAPHATHKSHAICMGLHLHAFDDFAETTISFTKIIKDHQM